MISVTGAREQLLARLVAEQLDGGLVGEQQAPVRRLGGHAVGHAAQDRLELVARLVGVDPRELLEAQQLVALLLRRRLAVMSRR